MPAVGAAAAAGRPVAAARAVRGLLTYLAAAARVDQARLGRMVALDHQTFSALVMVAAAAAEVMMETREELAAPAEAQAGQAVAAVGLIMAQQELAAPAPVGRLGFIHGEKMRKAIVEITTGLIINVIEIEPDNDGGYDHWGCPDGCELIDAIGDAQLGATWNGSQFIAPVIPTPTRLELLMVQGPATLEYDGATDVMVDRPIAGIAADNAELLGLLQAKLAASEDLSWEEMNKMLALERNS